ncbi:hypothetical protein HDV01_004730, partial [Terramyces sp. JEL0728]
MFRKVLDRLPGIYNSNIEMDTNYMIATALAAAATLIVGITTLVLKTPKGYLPINNRELNFQQRSNLKILSWFICLVSLFQIGASAYAISNHQNEMNIIIDQSVLILYWILVVFSSSAQSQKLLVSLYALFISLLLDLLALAVVIIENIKFKTIQELNLPEQVLISQLLVSLSLLIVVGVWNLRDEDDDVDNISKEQGSSIISMLFYNWLSPLIKLGGSKPIDIPDLWNLIDTDSSDKVLLDYEQIKRSGTRARIVIIEELYQKSLRRVQGVSTKEKENASLGKIVTLMSVDTNKLRQLFAYSHDYITGMPLSAIISITSLYFVLGWSAFVGIGLIIVLSPLSTYIGKSIVKYQEQSLKNTDARVAIMNEVLQGIRIIKYFAWEQYFTKKVEAARHKELMSNIALWASNIAIHSIGTGSGIIIAFTTFAVYTFVEGKTLDTATAFTAINLLNTTTEVLAGLPYRVMDIFRAKVSFDRIQGFLKEQELDKYEKEKQEDHHSDSETESDFVLGFKNAEFTYHSDSTPTETAFALRNLDAEFPVGSLTVVCGPTGSGKSSLLLALLGEMNKVCGKMAVPTNDPSFNSSGHNQTIAYAAQTAWILNATVRENITFGHEYDPVRYEKVVRACALAKDFENLDGGDLTEIGEKGINLSGGQKQRISLARACYSPASIVLLDDPLSAVDAPTARFLLHKCILGVLKGRTVILVSHATHLVVPFADYIVSMKNGEIVNQGAPIQLVQNPEDESLFGLDLTRDEFEDIEESEVSVITAAGNGTTLVEDEEKATGA